MPHALESLVSQDNIDDASAVNGWIRVDWTSDLFDTRLSDLGFLLAAADHREASCALTVQTEVLGKRLE